MKTAARLIVKAKKSDHITPILKQLHWLPVKFRVMFKLNLLTHKFLNGSAPDYQKDLIERHHTVRTLRSENANRLMQPRFKLNSYGGRSFILNFISIYLEMFLDYP